MGVLKSIAATEKEIGKKVECVAIDEGQFVEGLFSFTRHLLDANHDVLVAGLDLDFRAIPFGDMLNLTWFVTRMAGTLRSALRIVLAGIGRSIRRG